MADKLTLARPYARAAYDVAQAAANVAAWQQALASLALAFDSSIFVAAISNPQLDDEKLLANLQHVLGEIDIHGFDNFLKLLIEYKRLALLPEIAELFAELVAQQEQMIDVHLTSAFSVSDELAEKFSARLQALLGRTVKLSRDVDTKLLGGAIIRAGDKVIDASVRSKLQRLHEDMVS